MLSISRCPSQDRVSLGRPGGLSLTDLHASTLPVQRLKWWTTMPDSLVISDVYIWFLSTLQIKIRKCCKGLERAHLFTVCILLLWRTPIRSPSPTSGSSQLPVTPAAEGSEAFGLQGHLHSSETLTYTHTHNTNIGFFFLFDFFSRLSFFV